MSSEANSRAFKEESDERENRKYQWGREAGVLRCHAAFLRVDEFSKRTCASRPQKPVEGQRGVQKGRSGRVIKRGSLIKSVTERQRAFSLANVHLRRGRALSLDEFRMAFAPPPAATNEEFFRNWYVSFVALALALALAPFSTRPSSLSIALGIFA